MFYLLLVFQEARDVVKVHDFFLIAVRDHY